MNTQPFDSRKNIYKSPFGAVRQGTSVHFRVLLPRSIGCCSCKLFIVREGDYCENRYEMFWCGMAEDDHYEWWECHYTPTDCALYWYRFDLTVSDGFCSVYKSGDSEGSIGNGLNCWQMTVYDRDFKTPDWLKGGIMYQIFPDRFNFSGVQKQGIYSDRIMHSSWQEKPSWKKDSDGEYRNNDYFGGDLAGIEQKLPYIASLGVKCIYLNPIFEAHSNHRYNTADYSRIDPVLGDEQDFRSLCKKADEYGIKIILDGVFSHSGSDSVYFNKEGRYDTVGAFNSEKSPFFSWYRFYDWPKKYECWWGFKTLPDIDEHNPEYIRYICKKDGILNKWLDNGASGWRLDVADELPDLFLESLRKSVKEKDEDALILGEVWEDASNKISYNSRRRFLLGHQLDTVMNYPFRRAVIDYIRQNKSKELLSTVCSVCENYPKPCVDILMNCLSTHDTERILTVAAAGECDGMDRNQQSVVKISRSQKEQAKRLVKMAAVIQYTLPGVPSVYYGDEAGMCGCKDPFNRGTFPWEELKGKKLHGEHKTDSDTLKICNTDYDASDDLRDTELTEWFCNLGKMRSECSELCEGEFVPLKADGGFLQYMRKAKNSALLITLNKTSEPAQMEIPEGYSIREQLLWQEDYLGRREINKKAGTSDVAALEMLTKCEKETAPCVQKDEIWLQGMDFRIVRLQPEE